MSTKTNCDIIVIGGGSAALEAAIAAQRGRRRLRRHAGEGAAEAESGGNAQFSHVGFRFVHSGAEELRGFLPQVPEERYSPTMQIPAYTRQNFIDDLNRVTQGASIRVLARLPGRPVQRRRALDAATSASPGSRRR